MEENVKNRSPSIDSSIDPFSVSNLIGQGRYQKYLIIFLCCFVSPFMACNNIPQYLILLEPEYECRVNNISIYDDIPVPQRAHIPTSLFLRLKRDCYLPNTTEPCPYGYNYKYDFIYPTIVSMNDWICDNSHPKFDAHSLYWFGSFFGVLVIGHISDKYDDIFDTFIDI